MARGSGPLQRLYQAADGWLFLGAKSEQRAALAGVEGLAGCADLDGNALGAFLVERFAGRPVADWVADLTAAGLGAHAANTSLTALMRDRWVAEHGLSVTRPHDTGEEITTVGPAARLSRTPVEPGRPAPTPGADAASVLRQAGLPDALQRLCDEGVVLVETPRTLAGAPR
jgi:crotonobetainyl-CoA:carnitine CoA-transferase CaiB-like acyl-CoA transferase